MLAKIVFRIMAMEYSESIGLSKLSLLAYVLRTKITFGDRNNIHNHGHGVFRLTHEVGVGDGVYTINSINSKDL